MLKVLQWPFKGFGNFSITALGIVGLTFWGYSIYSEGKFNQPIIGESIKLLGKHPQIKELVGYPLTYSFAISNRFVEKEGQSYFSFKVSGPKTTTNVEMTAASVPASQVYSYQQKYEKIAALQQKIQEQQKRVTELETEISKATSKRQKQLALEKASKANNIKTLKQELTQAKFEVIDQHNRYFVPSKEIYTKINDPRSKNSDQPLAKDEQLWGINDLVITLPNRTKMIVYPEAKKSLQQKQVIVKHSDLPTIPTYSILNKKIFIDISQFSKEEVEEYGKQKTNFMYSKYGSYRMLSFILFFAAIGGLVVYKKKTVIKSIKGSILEDQIKNMVKKNENVIKILKEKNKKEAEFDSLIGGGLSNNEFDCVMYLKSLTNGRIEFSGKYLQDLNVYKYDKLILKYREKQLKKEIDLLK